MPEIEEALYGRLIGFGPLVAFIGDRVFAPDSVPQAPAYPYVIYQRVSTPRATAMGRDPMLAWPRFQLTVMAKEDNQTAYLNAKAVMVELRGAFRDNTTGQRFRGVQNGVTIQDTIMLDETDLPSPDAGVHGLTLDIMIWHGE